MTESPIMMEDVPIELHLPLNTRSLVLSVETLRPNSSRFLPTMLAAFSRDAVALLVSSPEAQITMSSTYLNTRML